jgi:nucleoside-diphosphate-sugar epimerase
MRTTRREFLSASMAVGAAAAVTGVGTRAWAQRRPIPPEDKKRILILGGTAFLGPACMDAALARGHKVTLFNRGRIEQKRKEAGRPLDIPAGVEELYGNRDPNLTADDWKKKPEDGTKDPNAAKGLTQLEGKSWDAVIDTSGFWPRIVRASAELLAPRVKQYIFISSLSAYVRNDGVGKDESDEVAVLKDPDTEDFGKEFENYGAGKAACEAAAEKAMTGRVANLRAGFIVGPRDTSGRFIYWPLRVERGGEMAVPGKPTDPIQLIDVRDLAEWIVRLIETNTNGVFNATGPERTLTMLDMLQGCAAATTPPSNATFTFMDAEFLKAKNVSEGDFPLWIAPEGENAGFHQRSVAKAVAAGLRFRSVQETAKGTLEWYHALPSDIQAKVAKLLPPEREEMLLKDWKERAK